MSLASRRMISASYVSQCGQRCKETGSSLRGVEKIVGGIRHAELLIGMRSIATRRGRLAAFGVEALDGGGPQEHAVALVADHLDEQPWNGIGVRRRRVGDGFSGDTAAVIRLP
jgi:hypothetical protein